VLVLLLVLDCGNAGELRPIQARDKVASPGRFASGRFCYGAAMTKEQMSRRPEDDLSEAEWSIIEERAVRRDLATDEEVERLFAQYRSAWNSSLNAAILGV
jgi:hypothetical protein